MNPYRAHARIEAAQPWYSIGLLCLSLGLLIDLFAPPLWVGGFDVRDFAMGFLFGLGVAMLVASLLRQQLFRRGRT
jgi:hypothetical protein